MRADRFSIEPDPQKTPWKKVCLFIIIAIILLAPHNRAVICLGTAVWLVAYPESNRSPITC